MTLEQLNEINDLAGELEEATERVQSLKNLKVVFDKVESKARYTPIHVAGTKAMLESGHFGRFLDVEIARAESEADRLREKFATL